MWSKWGKHRRLRVCLDNSTIESAPASSLVRLAFVLVFGAACSISHTQQVVRSVFSGCEREDLSDMTFEHLICDWFELPVVMKPKMFNPVYLPFRYKGDVPKPDPMQAYTFPFLLSLKFDWVPDNLCRDHPFYVFRRSRSLVTSLATQKEHLLGRVPVLRPEEGYKSSLVQKYVRDWYATHAIGGELYETSTGWGGALLVYDDSGSVVLAKRYPPNAGYFDLMALMVRDWMRPRGQPVSDELARELRRPMTKNRDAIRLLGTATFVPARTEAEWRIYENILRLDPDFAEVRWWHANQREWSDSDQWMGHLARAEALKSGLVVAAIREVDTEKVPDQRFFWRFRQLVEEAAKISPNHCQISHKLLEVRHGRNVPIAEMPKYDKLFLQNPHYEPLVGLLGRTYREQMHYEKAIPMALTQVGAGQLHAHGYRYGSGYGVILGNTARHFRLLGYYRRAAWAARAGLKECEAPEDKERCLFNLAKSMAELFDFSSASEAMLECFKISNKMRDVCPAILWLYEANNPGAAAQLESEHADLFKATGWYPVIQARGLIAEGKFEEAAGRLKGAERASNYPYEEGSLVKAELGLLIKDPEWRSELSEHLLYYPNGRRAWFLLDKYNREWPRREDEFFYYACPRIFPGDEWLAKIARDYASRSGGESPNLNELAAQLLEGIAKGKKVWDILRAPFAAEAAIVWLVEKGKHDSALKICQAYEAQLERAYETHTAFAHHLSRLIHQARERGSRSLRPSGGAGSTTKRDTEGTRR